MAAANPELQEREALKGLALAVSMTGARSPRVVTKATYGVKNTVPGQRVLAIFLRPRCHIGLWRTPSP